jgi:hypothetical protein
MKARDVSLPTAMLAPVSASKRKTPRLVRKEGFGSSSGVMLSSNLANQAQIDNLQSSFCSGVKHFYGQKNR